MFKGVANKMVDNLAQLSTTAWRWDLVCPGGMGHQQGLGVTSQPMTHVMQRLRSWQHMPDASSHWTA